MKAFASLVIVIALLAGCATQQTGKHEPRIELKKVSLNTFMNDDLAVQIPIMLAIPTTYVHADIEAPLTYSYWMPRDKVPQAKANRDLPTDTGWIYGNISLSVGYDQRTKEFFVDGGHTVDELLVATGYEALEKERISVNNHPVLFMKVHEKKSGKKYYTIYIGMMLETNNIFIGYLPPLDDPDQGAYVWAQLKKSIKESNKTFHRTDNPAVVVR